MAQLGDTWAEKLCENEIDIRVQKDRPYAFASPQESVLRS